MIELGANGLSRGRWRRLPAVWLTPLLASTLFGALGCDVPLASFEANRVFTKRLEISEDVDLQPVAQQVNAILQELFGTPDKPRWPATLADDPQAGQLVSLERLQRAAGAVRSDEAGVHYGLYREHCILCHGVSGGGAGPTSRLLNPYPRDFRLGIFKFKSTPQGAKPTREDLARTLHEGIVGTSMPSFSLLIEDDVQALVDYVIYLGIRGEVERRLLLRATYELDVDAGPPWIDLQSADRQSPEFTEQWQEVQQVALAVARSWSVAAGQARTQVSPPQGFPLVGQSEQAGLLAESIARGREIFHGPIGNCVSCHGADGSGQGQPADYDVWTKDWTVQARLDPTDKEQLRPLLKLGALKPRVIQPRDLRRGIYRGGSRPEDLYRRIVHGIDGTPMPAVPRQPDNPLGLSERDVWDLVNYLLDLPQRSLDDSL
ncbi:MAG: c-type cytochrome [Planctomycetales bacterium]|nr:c-type cytochrome [Planctomycetales bacterium]